MHLLISPLHFDHSWEHGAALATVGVLDLAWTAAWLSSRSRALIYAGWFLTAFTLTLYGISRVLPLPFEGRPEAIDALNLGTQLFELSALLALTALGALTRGRGRIARPLAADCSLGFAAAWFVFGGAALAAAAIQ